MNSVEENSKVNVRATILSSDKLQVAAVFDSTEQAKQALQQLESEASIDSHQSDVITPSDPRLSAKLEEKSSQIASSLWTSHLALAAIGFAAGMITAFLLTQYGPALTQQNPIFRSTRKHSIWLICPFVNQVINQHSNVCIRSTQDKCVFFIHRLVCIYSSHQTLTSCFFVTSRSIDLPCEKQIFHQASF